MLPMKFASDGPSAARRSSGCGRRFGHLRTPLGNPTSAGRPAEGRYRARTTCAFGRWCALGGSRRSARIRAACGARRRPLPAIGERTAPRTLRSDNAPRFPGRRVGPALVRQHRTPRERTASTLASVAAVEPRRRGPGRGSPCLRADATAVDRASRRCASSRTTLQSADARTESVTAGAPRSGPRRSRPTMARSPKCDVRGRSNRRCIHPRAASAGADAHSGGRRRRRPHHQTTRGNAPRAARGGHADGSGSDGT